MIFHWGGKTEWPKIEAEGKSEVGQQAPPTSLGDLRGRRASPVGFGAEPRLPKDFPLFSVLSSHWGQNPVPLAYTPGTLNHCETRAGCGHILESKKTIDRG